jgi:hypothetical protein
MATNAQEIEKNSNNVHAQYMYAFAGKPRLTRRGDLLERMIADTRGLVKQATGLGGSGTKVLGIVKERLALYEAELKEVQAAQSQGPAAIEAAILATRANLAFFVYRRHFAGKNRATRDAGLLQDILTYLEAVRREYEALGMAYPTAINAGDREAISSNLTLYQAEVAEITNARSAGTLEEQGSALAAVANAQFEAYRVHFAGKSRLSRRPGLIQRLVTNLQQARAGMEGLRAAGLTVEFNERNIGIVSERLAVYENEKREIETARQATQLDGLVDAYATAANEIMAEYNKHFAGQNRATREPQLLSDLYDQLWEVERQMNDLNSAVDNTANLQNLHLVQDTLMVYSREYDEILKARGEKLN